MTLLTRIALRRAHSVFAPSYFTARQVERAAGLGKGSVRLVHHGLSDELSIEKAPASEPSDPVVLSVARLDAQDAYKGIDSLLYVWPRVTGRKPGAHLWVIGDGPDALRLKATGDALMLDGTVRFFGAVSDKKLARLYRHASVFALPSRTGLPPQPEGEGFGLVYIEAGAAGLPVIGARGGGADEAIEHGRTGLLVDPDDPTQLEEAIVTLLADESCAKRMGEEGRKRAESEFSYEAFANRICALVDELFTSRMKDR